MRLLQNLKGSLNRALARRAWLDAALSEVIGEVAFVWAHFQLASEPKDALDEQIVGFGLAGALDAIQGMLAGKCRLRESERWDLLFAGVIHAQAHHDHRYDDAAVRGAIAKAKMRLCPPPRRWPQSRLVMAEKSFSN